jgi:hypothetical protein
MMKPRIALDRLDKRIQNAVNRFWTIRSRQSSRQGRSTGKRDAGRRADVTGGKHIDGFIELVRDILIDNGIERKDIYYNRRVDLPGFFRPEKKWDLLVIPSGQLVAAVEFKSQTGPSFGNNYNNRSEEAVGNAYDLRTAYRDGAYKPSPKPWVGYFMLLEETDKSTKPVRVTESHFDVFPEFKDASYAERYQATLNRMLREGLYDGASLLLTSRKGRKATFREPDKELAFRRFAASLVGRVIAAASGG